MTKSKFLFTAILATMISAGAWAYAPGDTTADGSTAVGTGAHDVYVDAPTDDEAGAGIAGVTYVNRVANRAGAAAQAAENHAAHASASASAAQTSADAAATAAADAASAAEVAKNITAGDGVVVTDVLDEDDKKTVIGKKIAVNPGEGIKTADDGTVAVNSATETELGGLFAPASLEELQATGDKLGELGLSIFDPKDQAMIAVTFPLANEMIAQGAFDNVVHYKNDDTINETSGPLDTVEDLYTQGEGAELIKRPLSAFGALQLASEVKAHTVQLPENAYGEVTTNEVGSDSRPVYVASSNNKGVVTPIESVAVPVGDDNFTEAQSTAIIWIQ